MGANPEILAGGAEGDKEESRSRRANRFDDALVFVIRKRPEGWCMHAGDLEAWVSILELPSSGFSMPGAAPRR